MFEVLIEHMHSSTRFLLSTLQIYAVNWVLFFTREKTLRVAAKSRRK